MYTGATQADVTTAAVNVIVIMSHTTHFFKYTPGCPLHWFNTTFSI